MRLAFDRIERIGSDRAEITEQWEIAVDRAPAMPASVEQIAPGRWQVREAKPGMTVIKTWRLLDAARVAA